MFNELILFIYIFSVSYCSISTLKEILKYTIHYTFYDYISTVILICIPISNSLFVIQDISLYIKKKRGFL